MPDKYQPKHRKSAHNHRPDVEITEDCPACAEERRELVRLVRAGMERSS